MRAVITVTGKDRTGIIAKISNTLYEHQVNIIDISQNVMDDVFAMVMLVNIDKCTVDFNTLGTIMESSKLPFLVWYKTCMRTSLTQCTKSDKLTESRAGNRFSTLNFSGGLVKCL